MTIRDAIRKSLFRLKDWGTISRDHLDECKAQKHKSTKTISFLLPLVRPLFLVVRSVETNLSGPTVSDRRLASRRVFSEATQLRSELNRLREAGAKDSGEVIRCPWVAMQRWEVDFLRQKTDRSRDFLVAFVASRSQSQHLSKGP